MIRLFPGARFIHLCRDGRDVVKSFQQRGWYGPWLHENTREWNEALAYRERWNHIDAKSSILDVRYEDLVLDTERLSVAFAISASNSNPKCSRGKREWRTWSLPANSYHDKLGGRRPPTT